VARSKAEIKAIIAGARRPERIVEIPMRGDLQAEMGQLEERLIELEAAKAKPGASLSGSPEAAPIAARIEELRAEMRESVVEFRVRALPKVRGRGSVRKEPTWDELKDANPPRDDNADDKQQGVNLDEFHEQLLRLSIVDPVLDDEDWAALLDVLTDGTYSLLVNQCYAVNRRDIDVPFSSAALQILRSSGSE
jgi:hypothetical protein